MFLGVVNQGQGKIGAEELGASSSLLAQNHPVLEVHMGATLAQSNE